MNTWISPKDYKKTQKSMDSNSRKAQLSLPTYKNSSWIPTNLKLPKTSSPKDLFWMGNWTERKCLFLLALAKESAWENLWPKMNCSFSLSGFYKDLRFQWSKILNRIPRSTLLESPGFQSLFMYKSKNETNKQKHYFKNVHFIFWYHNLRTSTWQVLWTSCLITTFPCLSLNPSYGFSLTTWNLLFLMILWE